MSIFAGTSEIKSIKAGTADVKAVYAGSTKVWEAGPQLPTGPVHSWSSRTHYANATGTDSITTRISKSFPDHDLIIQGAAYSYGPNSDPRSADIDIMKWTHGANAHREISSQTPIRYSLYGHATSTQTQGFFTYIGQGYEPYWPDTWLGYAFQIPAAKLPWPAGTNPRYAFRKDSNYCESTSAKPNSIAIGFVWAVSVKKETPTIGGALSVIGGNATRFIGASLGYQFFQADATGKVRAEFTPSYPGGIGRSITGMFYLRDDSRSFDDDGEIFESEEPYIESEILPTPEVTDE